VRSAADHRGLGLAARSGAGRTFSEQGRNFTPRSPSQAQWAAVVGCGQSRGSKETAAIYYLLSTIYYLYSILLPHNHKWQPPQAVSSEQ
jgi:hypothetical protein